MLYRWDISWGEANADRAERYLREGLPRRMDGGLDRRYTRCRFVDDYQNGRLWFG